MHVDVRAAARLAQLHHRADVVGRGRSSSPGCRARGSRRSSPGRASRPAEWTSTRLPSVARPRSGRSASSRGARGRTRAPGARGRCPCAGARGTRAKPEAERLRGLRLPGERRVVERQAIERVAQVLVAVGVDREQARRTRPARPRDSPGSGSAAAPCCGVRVSPTCRRATSLIPVITYPTSPAAIAGAGVSSGVRLPISSISACVPACIAAIGSRLENRPSTIPHVGDARRGTGRTRSRRSAPGGPRWDPPGPGIRVSTIASGDVPTPLPGLGRDPQRVVACPQSVHDLARRRLRLGARQVDLVDDGDQLEAPPRSPRRCWRPSAPRRPAPRRRPAAPLARGEAARHLVREVDVAGGVDQVQVVGLAVRGRVGDPHGLSLDRDPALALEVHRVEHLGPHLRRVMVASARGCGRPASTSRGRCGR